MQAVNSGLYGGTDKDYFDKKAAQCNITDFDLEVEKGVMIKVFVIRPKGLPEKGNACEIHAHGGGAVLLDA